MASTNSVATASATTTTSVDAANAASRGGDAAEPSAVPCVIPVQDHGVYVRAADDHKATSDLQITRGEWDVGLFDCFFDLVPNCVTAFCCTWFSLAQVTSRVGLLKPCNALFVFGSVFALMMFTGFVMYWFTERVYEDDDGKDAATTAWAGHNVTQEYRLVGSSFAVLCHLLHRITVGFFFLMVSIVRCQVRRTFDIPGNPFTDLLVSALCNCCVTAQMAKHVKSYHPGDCRLSMPDRLPAYVV